MPESIVLQSPLVEIAVGQPVIDQPGVRVAEKPFLHQFILRGRSGDGAFTHAVEASLGLELPVVPNTVTASTDMDALWMGPDQWLLLTESKAGHGRISKLADSLEAEFAQLNDVSSGQTVLEIEGEKAREVLARGTTLDVHPREFRPGQCAQTVFAKMNVLIRPRDSGGEYVYDLIVRRSFADFLARWLRRNCVQYEEQ